MALRVPGRGMPAEKPGIPPGDLFIVVRTADDPRFVRHGRDLYRIETVEAVDAVLGASIDVPTLEGEVSVKVPAGTQPDSMLRLREKGLPGFGRCKRRSLCPDQDSRAGTAHRSPKALVRAAEGIDNAKSEIVSQGIASRLGEEAGPFGIFPDVQGRGHDAIPRHEPFGKATITSQEHRSGCALRIAERITQCPS